MALGALWLLSLSTNAAEYTISTYAGVAAGAEPVRVETARLFGFIHVSWVDGYGLLLSDGSGSYIRKIDITSGAISRLVQLPDVPDDNLGGVLLGVSFTSPDGIVGDATGTIYISRDHCIRKITPAGNIIVLAGKPGANGAVDGVGAAARFYSPTGLALNSSGTRLFVADTRNDLIRSVDTTTGEVTTLAGKAIAAALIDGVGGDARFNLPNDIALYGDDQLYVADTFNHAIRLVTPTGRVTTLAGSAAGTRGAVDGVGSAARFDGPVGIAVDVDGMLYVADENNAAIRIINRETAEVRTLAGSLREPGYVDASGSAARFNGPSALALDRTHRRLYVADFYNQVIRNIDLTSANVTTAVGVFVGRDGPLALSRFSFVSGITVAPTGPIFVADSFSSTIRKISPQGVVTTPAGKTYVSGEVDGPFGVSRLDGLSYLTSDREENVYFTSLLHTIRKLSPDGQVTTIAGQTNLPGTSNGPANQARFNAPRGIAIDEAGNLLIADTRNTMIRKLSPNGVVSTVAGTPNASEVVDGIGNAAHFAVPLGIAVDAADNIYVSDSQTIRRISSKGVVTTIAGSAYNRGFQDGIGANARFNEPEGLAVDASGTVFVADSANRVIRRVTPDGIVSTIAGQPKSAGSEDGLEGRFSTPFAVSIAANGTLFVTDWDHSTVRAVTASPDSRLTNLSVRAMTGVNDQTLIAGISMTGNSSKRLLLRCVGPTLSQFGVAGALADPTLQLFSGANATLIAENDNWGGSLELRETIAAAGGFPLGINDSALVANMNTGAYTVHALAKGDSGVVLLEVYDTEPTRTSSRLSNLSVRGTSDPFSPLLAGFVVRGDVNKTFLIRGLGPTLRLFGLAGAVNDPSILVYASDGTLLSQNDDWASQPDALRVGAAASAVGAVALASNTRDAALLLTLRPGAYTIQFSTSFGDTGIGLIELYEAP